MAIGMGTGRQPIAQAWLAIRAVACVALLAGCGSSDGFNYDNAAAQISQRYVADRCSKYFNIGSVSILDSKIVGNEATLKAAVQLSKNQAFTDLMDHVTVMNMGQNECIHDFYAGRFQNLAKFFAQNPIGTSTNYTGMYQFEKWQSGWKLKDDGEN